MTSNKKRQSSSVTPADSYTTWGQETYDVAILGDTHLNRPYGKGSRVHHTKFGNDHVHGLLALPKQVHEIVFSGDFFEEGSMEEQILREKTMRENREAAIKREKKKADKNEDKLGILDDVDGVEDAKAKKRHSSVKILEDKSGLAPEVRYNPLLLLETLVKEHPQTRFVYVRGNHDGSPKPEAEIPADYNPYEIPKDDIQRALDREADLEEIRRTVPPLDHHDHDYRAADYPTLDSSPPSAHDIAREREWMALQHLPTRPAEEGYDPFAYDDLPASLPSETYYNDSHSRHRPLPTGEEYYRAQDYPVLPSSPPEDHVVLSPEDKRELAAFHEEWQMRAEQAQKDYRPEDYDEGPEPPRPDSEFYEDYLRKKKRWQENREIAAGLDALAARYPNLEVVEEYTKDNVMVVHGHSFIADKMRSGKGEVMQYLVSEQVDGNDPILTNEGGLAHAIASTRPVYRFIQDYVYQVPEGAAEAEVHIFFGHIHESYNPRVDEDNSVYKHLRPKSHNNPKQLDTAVLSFYRDEFGNLSPYFGREDDAPEGAYLRVNVHVTNLGALLPGRGANSKLIHFSQEGEGVTSIEPLSLKRVPGQDPERTKSFGRS